MKITEWMEKNVCTCRPEDSLAEAAETMLKEDVGALPVVDSTDKLVGMITDRDICMSGLIEGRPLRELPVSLAASTPAWACGIGDSLASACQAMQTHRIRRIPVVDAQEKLVGILGLHDVARATANKKSGATGGGLRQTLAAILEPRERAEALQGTAPPQKGSPV